MDWYLITKTIHIISATILFGTGIGIAFFMWWANKKGDLAAKVFATNATVIADFIFTLPSVIIQPITGIILIRMVGYDYANIWLILTYSGYIIAGICWVPVVFIQMRLRTIVNKSFKENIKLPAEYYKLFKIWFYLGWPAFISLVIIFFLMVFKPT
jgi:uncharacterized membrane protein